MLMRLACVFMCVAVVSSSVWSHLCTVFVPSFTLMEGHWSSVMARQTNSSHMISLPVPISPTCHIWLRCLCLFWCIVKKKKKTRKKGHAEACVHLFLAQTQTYSEWKDIKQQHHRSIAKLVSLTWWATAKKAFDIQGEKPVGCNLMWFIFADSFFYLFS